jgi:hypothetical protein
MQITQPTAALSDFELKGLPVGAAVDWTTSTKLCIRRDTGIKYIMKRRRMPRHYSWTEHNILETLNKLELAFVPYLHWTFYSGEHRYIVTVSKPFASYFMVVQSKEPHVGLFSLGCLHGSH